MLVAHYTTKQYSSTFVLCILAWFVQIINYTKNTLINRSTVGYKLQNRVLQYTIQLPKGVGP